MTDQLITDLITAMVAARIDGNGVLTLAAVRKVVLKDRLGRNERRCLDGTRGGGLGNACDVRDPLYRAPAGEYVPGPTPRLSLRSPSPAGP